MNKLIVPTTRYAATPHVTPGKKIIDMSSLNTGINSIPVVIKQSDIKKVSKAITEEVQDIVV